MSNEPPGVRLKNEASGIAALVVTGTWLAMLMLGFPSGIWLAVMLFGYIVVVPVVSILFDEETDTEWTDGLSTASNERTTDEETPLERLRRRYAEGELTDEQFERKLDRLLETETLEDIEDRTNERRDQERETE